MTTKKIKKSASKKPAMKATNNGAGDILRIIIDDHKPLKKLIKVLKDSDNHDLQERRTAFEEFAPLLVTHAKSEEQVLYVYMKADDELREEGFEGDVEHGLADQMVEEVKRTDDDDLWSARVKVLAELVEHHIKEEEEEMFPDIRKNSEAEDRRYMGEQYAALKDKYMANGGKDTVDEKRSDKKNKKELEEARLNH